MGKTWQTSWCTIKYCISNQEYIAQKCILLPAVHPFPLSQCSFMWESGGLNIQLKCVIYNNPLFSFLPLSAAMTSPLHKGVTQGSYRNCTENRDLSFCFSYTYFEDFCGMSLFITHKFLLKIRYFFHEGKKQANMQTHSFSFLKCFQNKIHIF